MPTTRAYSFAVVLAYLRERRKHMSLTALAKEVGVPKNSLHYTITRAKSFNARTVGAYQDWASKVVPRAGALMRAPAEQALAAAIGNQLKGLSPRRVAEVLRMAQAEPGVVPDNTVASDD